MTVLPFMMSGECSEDQFFCESGYGCLEKSLLCDNRVQCLDGSDEFGCGKNCK